MAFSTAVFLRSPRRRITILLGIACLLALAGLWVVSRRVAQNSPDLTNTSAVVKKLEPIHIAAVLAEPAVAETHLVVGTDSHTTSTTRRKAIKHTFVHIPKTGGSALEKIVGQTIENPSAINAINLRGQRCSRRHVPPSWFEESASPYAGTQSFTVLRNPYARVISEYRFMCWGPRKTAVMKKLLKKGDLGTVEECKRNYAQMNDYIDTVLPTANKDPEIASLVRAQSTALPFTESQIPLTLWEPSGQTTDSPSLKRSQPTDLPLPPAVPQTWCADGLPFHSTIRICERSRSRALFSSASPAIC